MDPYEKLREKIDQSSPIPTPATESKVEIEILKRIFNLDEAEIACQLSGQPQDVATIAKRAGMEVGKLKTALEEMVKKGAIFKVYTEEPLYALSPIVPGIFEWQLGKLTPGVAELFEKYYE